MKNIYKILAVLNVVILLCSCTAEPKCDLIEFCRRANRRSEIEIDSSAYYLDGESEYCYFLQVGASDCILTLSTDDESCVNELRLTAVNDGAGIDGAALFDYYLTLCSVLTNVGNDELKELFSKNGITETCVAFADNSCEIEGERFSCFIYTQQQLVSLCCTAT